MPENDHQGFEPWAIDDLNFPYPIGQIDLSFGTKEGAAVNCDFEIPTALPKEKVFAERSIGISDSFKFWVALECAADDDGTIRCEAVLRGWHNTWFEDHGETRPGPHTLIRLSPLEAAGTGWRQVLGEHWEHCDTLTATWFQSDKGRTKLNLVAFHYCETPDQFRANQKRAREEAEHEPKLHLDPLPDYDFTNPAPKPPPPKIDR